jgi:hypothetical protein
VTEYEIVLAAERYLGWIAPRGMALWQARQAEVKKLKHAMKKVGVTTTDVAFALEMSRRQRNPVDSPAALVWRVEQARELAVDERRVELDVQIQEAIDFEMDVQMDGWDQWVSRLSRCSGQMRREVFNEWAEQRLVEVA